eukprot:Rmarinus@m.5468
MVSQTYLWGLRGIFPRRAAPTRWFCCCWMRTCLCLQKCARACPKGFRTLSPQTRLATGSPLLVTRTEMATQTFLWAPRGETTPRGLCSLCTFPLRNWSRRSTGNIPWRCRISPRLPLCPSGPPLGPWETTILI